VCYRIQRWAVIIFRLSIELEAEEQELAALEAAELAALPEVAAEGEEILLPYAFVPRRIEAGAAQAGPNDTHL